ncbi:SPOR domain-containing protein [Nitrobacter sp. JJSN]|uniref:SPOR domain-containing protein n=1 Tax=Nitrobacter sp. JJSN TaxID=3453033 RepID=UPI003F76AA69
MAHRYQDRPFPEDDYGRDEYGATAQAEPDPLAELARLIGQTDPFADVKRSAPTVPADDPVDHFEPLPPIEDDVPPEPPSWIQRRMVQPDPPQEVEAAPHPVLRRAAVYPDNEPHDQYPEPESYRQADPDRYDDVLFGRLPDGQGAAYAYEDQFPRETYSEAPFGYQDGYGVEENEPAPKRRGGMATVVAVLALAVIGTGAAYAYRNYAGTARSGTPPVIKADAGPNKILPQRTGSGDAVGKLIQDRMSTENGTEQMVSREEQPVDVKEATTSGPRVVFPPLNQNTNPPTAASVTPNIRPPATVANAGDEPRRVRTLTVRGDQADLAAATAARPEAQAAPHATRHAPPVTAAPGANAPLPLSPQASAEPRTRTASTNPAQAPAAVNTGGYVVQVSSQRNEADAQASFRALQGKFPSVLGSRAPLIKRADLGAKGVYYRAMVGPFGSSEEASHFCGNLKSAGGQCVIQRN